MTSDLFSICSSNMKNIFLAFETEYDGLNKDMQKESEDIHITYNTVSYFL